MAKGTTRKTAGSSGASGGGTLDATTRVCVIYGAEEMLKREAYDRLRDAIVAEHGDIETFNFDGLRVTLAEVFDELRTFSLLQAYKLVVVDDADEFVKRFREPMERYAAAPVDQATLVLRASKWNKGNLDKAIDKVGAIIKCEPMKSGEAEAWVIKRASSQHARKIDRAAATLLVARMGTHLMKLDSELGKLALMVDEKQPIDEELVVAATGRASDEAAWQVQAAILGAIVSAPKGGGIAVAGPMITKVRELIDVAGNDAVPLVWAMTDLCRKLYHAWKLRREGANDYEIGRTLKLFPPDRSRAYMSAMSRISADRAAALFDKIVERDARSKSGFGNSERHLECFCAEVALAVV